MSKPRKRVMPLLQSIREFMLRQGKARQGEQTWGFFQEGERGEAGIVFIGDHDMDHGGIYYLHTLDSMFVQYPYSVPCV
ncbi:putative vacuolar membrane protein [Fusarium oxysporum f. sp. albedinis]|nr:putative vacuolar membrane protein [Fusarium oxysporum f. sp. albedinis]